MVNNSCIDKSNAMLLYMTPLNLGSKAFRSPSPTMLKLNTSSMMVTLGATESMELESRELRPSVTMLPPPWEHPEKTPQLVNTRWYFIFQ